MTQLGLKELVHSNYQFLKPHHENNLSRMPWNKKLVHTLYTHTNYNIAQGHN